MKTLIKHFICCFVLLSFVAACGKKGGGGGGSKKYTNNFTNGIQTGEAAYDTIKNWLDAADTTPVGLHGILLKRTVSHSISFSNTGFYVMCEDTLIGIPGCVAPSTCFKRTNNGVMIGTVKMYGSNNLRYDDCDITTSFTPYIKANDTKLREAVLGKAGLYPIKELTRQQGGLFTVFFGSFGGSKSPVTYSRINTTIPAIANPEIGPINASQAERLIRFTPTF